MLRQETFQIETSNGSEYTTGFTSNGSKTLDLQQQLQRLEEIIVLDGLKFPLTRRTIIDEEQLLSQLLCVERCIPETIRSAEKVLQDKDDILAHAKQYAEEIVKSAEKRAAQIADELTIIQQAEMEAQQLRTQVKEEVEAIRQRNVSEVERVRRQTQQEINVMRQAAQSECEQIQLDADNYAEQVLKDLEQQLGSMLQVITNGRRHLQQASTKA